VQDQRLLAKAAAGRDSLEPSDLTDPARDLGAPGVEVHDEHEPGLHRIPISSWYTVPACPAKHGPEGEHCFAGRLLGRPEVLGGGRRGGVFRGERRLPVTFALSWVRCPVAQAQVEASADEATPEHDSPCQYPIPLHRPEKRDWRQVRRGLGGRLRVSAALPARQLEFATMAET
jgi:hypothetical protein